MARRRPGLAPGLALGLALSPVACAAWAGGARPVATDAFSVSPPPSPWLRAAPLDSPGRVTWGWSGKSGTVALLRVSLEAVPPDSAQDPVSAAALFLADEERRVRADVRGRLDYDLSRAESDSFSTAGTAWVGYHWRIQGPNTVGDVYRYVRVHPEFPARRRLFLIAYEEVTQSKDRATSRLDDVRRLAGTIAPRGKGLAGDIESAWLDARIATFGARIDSTDRLVWTARPGREDYPGRIGFGFGLAGEGDFYEFTDVPVGADSLVDPGSADYGAAFDRNGDGAYDLLIANRGIEPVKDGGMAPVVVAVADDNFDGAADGAVYEDLDLDGDGRADGRLLVRDLKFNGTPDGAWAFADAVDGKDAKRLAVTNGRVRVKRLGKADAELDLSGILRDWTKVLRELNDARRPLRSRLH